MRFRIFLFLALLGCVGLIRAPFFSQMLVGEEGAFAELVANPVPSSESTPNRLPQMLSGVVNGEHAYSPFQRNIVPYIILDKSGAIVRALSASDRSPDRTTVLVRLFYFSFFAVGIFGLLWRASASPLAAAIALFGLTAPLAVGVSIQPQIDGSTGVALAGLSCLLLVVAPSHRLSWLAFVIAGFLVGLARHELALAFGGAALAVLALRWRWGVKENQNLWLSVIGLLAGVASAVLASPEDYWAGYETMGRLYISGARRWEVWLHQLQFTWPVWLFAACGIVLICLKKKVVLNDKPHILLIYINGVAIAVGFSVSGWGGDGLPRYYVPALIVLIYAVSELVGIFNSMPSTLKKLSISCLVSEFIYNTYVLSINWFNARSITSYPGISLEVLRRQLKESSELSQSNHVIVLDHAALWLYYPKAEFISRDFGAEGAQQFLGLRYPSDVGRFMVKTQ